MTKTTLKLSKETKERLDKLKEHKKETYEEIIRKILYILHLLRENPARARKKLKNIEISQIKAKRAEDYEKNLIDKFENKTSNIQISKENKNIKK